MRGDRPALDFFVGVLGEFTPHARGSTESVKLFAWSFRVYPACAGIDLYGDVLVWKQASLPRMRGDRPRHAKQWKRRCLFTPHARGSTPKGREFLRSLIVYPACAGIDPMLGRRKIDEDGLPRMRGDRPSLQPIHTVCLAFTPHARGSTRSMTVFHT